LGRLILRGFLAPLWFLLRSVVGESRLIWANAVVAKTENTINEMIFFMVIFFLFRNPYQLGSAVHPYWNTAFSPKF
jgi:hypothetical protein